MCWGQGGLFCPSVDLRDSAQLGLGLKRENRGGKKIYLASFMTCVFSNFTGIFYIIQTFSLQPCKLQRRRLTLMNFHQFQEMRR